MPLFKCSNCGCMDNTACTNYAVRVYLHKLPALCSECDPDIKKWHGYFPKIQWNEEIHGPHDMEKING